MSQHVQLPAQGGFLRFFPTPSFLNFSATGVDISETSVKVLKLKETRDGTIPEFFEEKRIAFDIISQGDIRDVHALAAVLTELKKKYDMAFIRASLPEEKVYLFQMSIPYAENKEQLLHSIEFQLEEHVPIPPEDSVFDYDIIRKREADIEVSVTVFPKKVVESYQEAFRLAGLTPISFELEGQAIANAVIARGDEKSYMIVDFGRSRTGIVIVKNGIASFTSTVDIGGNALTEVIMEHFHVDEAEAQRMKNKKGVIHSEDNKELHDSLLKTISALRDEVNRHFLYWNTSDANRKEEDKISKIILCGGNASLAGLPEFLSLGIKVPVERADVWQNAFSYENYIPPLNYEEGLSYATTIGLALM
ncbi:pilus assembly protein PilM [Candidatus Kaiserbacteria bacterium]|nr:pilus assembly protein PilM [Candidatus Kaiserbacteria bacterium]